MEQYRRENAKPLFLPCSSCLFPVKISRFRVMVSCDGSGLWWFPVVVVCGGSLWWFPVMISCGGCLWWFSVVVPCAGYGCL